MAKKKLTMSQWSKEGQKSKPIKVGGANKKTVARVANATLKKEPTTSFTGMHSYSANRRNEKKERDFNDVAILTGTKSAIGAQAAARKLATHNKPGKRPTGKKK